MSGASPVQVSVLLCTRDHARALEPTLRAFAGLDLPADLPAELVVIDNGSKDDTAEVAARCAREVLEPRGVQCRYVLEGRPGQAHARNAGLEAARGEVILFTDDDVRPSANWLTGMSRPLLDGAADAVVGRVTLAPHLERPWMEQVHRSWLADTGDVSEASPRLVGASMGFRRGVCEAVPRFDTELGPGALGFMDDTLFSEQLQEAGFRLRTAFDTVVEHHPDADRLLRRSFLAAAAKHGRSVAYVAHHWKHQEVTWAFLREAKNRLRLAARRRREGTGGAAPDAEGIAEWEMLCLFYVHFFEHFRKERRRARGYDLRGLRKKGEAARPEGRGGV